jgi:hypothetical protein
MSLGGCETKVTEISVVCRQGDQPTGPVSWEYTGKVDPSVLQRIPRALDITLHYPGTGPRDAPPITTYFYRQNGATLRVASSAKATIPAKGTFTYHVDTGGYAQALGGTGRGGPGELVFFIEVDGSYFGGMMSPPTCGRWPDGHLEVGKASEVPDLKDRHPINLGAADWLEVSSLPTAVARRQDAEVSTYAFFRAPIALTEVKNETNVPDGPDKQEADIGVTTGTPLFTIARDPRSDASTAAQQSQSGGKP